LVELDVAMSRNVMAVGQSLAPLPAVAVRAQVARATAAPVATAPRPAGTFASPAPARPAWRAAPTGPTGARPAPPARAARQIPAPHVPPIPPPTPCEKLDQLVAIEKELLRCGACRVGPGRTKLVFGEGNPEAQLVFVGEAPGQEEDLHGRPFVGRAGELLTKMIGAMGLRRQDVYICNVLKCRPPGNRAPLTDEVAACKDTLLRQLKIIRPKVIVTLGNPATHAVLQTTEGIMTIRGRWRRMPTDDPVLADIKVMPTYHPSFVLRNHTPEIRKHVWDDLKEVLRELGLPVPKGKTGAE
jgi:DNA polymerase